MYCNHDAPAVINGVCECGHNVYAVGSIFYTSWGYDQTNVEFYVVVRESKASVWLERIGSYVRDGREYPDVDELEIRRIGMMVPSTPRGEMHRKGKHGAYIRMDYVRHAWPYTAGGCYSTDAAGVCGH